MFFGAKIVCDHCGKKAKEKTSVYRRGSRFCNVECRDAYEAQNPPPVAKGDPALLRQDLVILLDEAFTEANRRWGSSVTSGWTVTVSLGTGTASVGGMLGAIDQKHQEEQMQEAFMQFQTHTLRSAPLLRALGFPAEAEMIDSTDFQKDPQQPLIAALVKVRQQL